MEIGNPNSIHAFNQFEVEGHTERKYNHFRLIDLTREELYAMGVPTILHDDEKENVSNGSMTVAILKRRTIA